VLVGHNLKFSRIQPKWGLATREQPVKRSREHVPSGLGGTPELLNISRFTRSWSTVALGRARSVRSGRFRLEASRTGRDHPRQSPCRDTIKEGVEDGKHVPLTLRVQGIGLSSIALHPHARTPPCGIMEGNPFWIDFLPWLGNIA